MGGGTLRRGERFLSRFSAGSSGSKGARGDGAQDPVDVLRAAPLLVPQHIAPDRFLHRLDPSNVPQHALLLEALRQLCRHRRRRV